MLLRYVMSSSNWIGYRIKRFTTSVLRLTELSNLRTSDLEYSAELVLIKVLRITGVSSQYLSLPWRWT